MALTPASILADYTSGIGTQGATLKVNTSDKRIGIGTTNPQGTLQVGTGITMGSGIITATAADFSGNVTAATGTFSGNVSVGGTLTYEDVTNIDSVGVITARNGINIAAGGAVVSGGATVVGLSTFTKIAIGATSGLWAGYPALAPNLHVHSNVPETSNACGISFGPDPHGAGPRHAHLVWQANNQASFWVFGGSLQLAADQGVGLGNNIGIGTISSPGSERLHVVGDSKFVGILTATSSITGSNYEIAGISSSISDTAVDVFVYDTRKDSDGGAWRKRTQNTSWYNEAVSDTRGSRKEFPAVAVFVAESNPNKITVYDGDDPDLPMWMEFSTSTGSGSTDGNFLAIAGQTLSSISIINGDLCIGFPSGNGWGICRVNFVSDSQGWYWTSANIFKQVKNTVAGRNAQNGYYNSFSGISGLSNASVNDVAMTVLPNAPVDSATGLPVPTIAIATNGGPSVIKDDGTVVNYTRGGNEYTGSVAFDELDDLIISWGTTVGGYRHATRITNPFVGTTSLDATYGYIAPDLGLGGGAAGGTNGVVTVANSGRHFGIDFDIVSPPATQGNHDDRVYFLHINDADTTKSLVAYATTSYNTGWMHGNIKGAFLSGISTTNAVGSNLIDATAAQWTTYAGSGSVTNPSSGVLQVADSNGTYDVYQDITTVAGKEYILSYNTTSVRETYFVITDASNSVVTNGNNFNYTGTYTGVKSMNFIAPAGTTTRIRVSDGSGGALTVTASDLQLRISEEDRSVNNNGLQVFGTVTKSAVATGAELVAYSGWSGTNVLRQPPNSDMNIGTGDAYEMIWYKTTATSGTMMLISYEGGANGTNDYGKPFNIRFHAGSVGGWASHNGFTTWDNIYDTASTADGNWHCAAWVRRGAVFELYVDGRFAGSVTGAVGSNALSDANSELIIGARKRGEAPGSTNHQEPFVGSIALARIGKSAPSAEQIKKIYEDEKCLFQENAKATLYGSSDAVTALAYDDTTELLHVGTSAGRSEFQGLRRINNTTTAVTTAISASNDLVAEQ